MIIQFTWATATAPRLDHYVIQTTHIPTIYAPGVCSSSLSVSPRPQCVPFEPYYPTAHVPIEPWSPPVDPPATVGLPDTLMLMMLGALVAGIVSRRGTKQDNEMP